MKKKENTKKKEKKWFRDYYCVECGKIFKAYQNAKICVFCGSINIVEVG